MDFYTKKLKKFNENYNNYIIIEELLEKLYEHIEKGNISVEKNLIFNKINPFNTIITRKDISNISWKYDNGYYILSREYILGQSKEDILLKINNQNKNINIINIIKYHFTILQYKTIMNLYCNINNNDIIKNIISFLNVNNNKLLEKCINLPSIIIKYNNLNKIQFDNFNYYDSNFINDLLLLYNKFIIYYNIIILNL